MKVYVSSYSLHVKENELKLITFCVYISAVK